MKTMLSKIQFSFEDEDIIFELTTNYHPKIGDTVYYELKGNEPNYKEIKELINNNSDMEGIVSEKWTCLSDNYIVWSVYMKR